MLSTIWLQKLFWSNHTDLKSRLISQIAILLFFLEVPYFFIFGQMGFSMASYMVIPAASANLVVLFLNYRKQHTSAGIALILFCSITLLYYSCLLGRSANAQLVYFALAPLGFVFFFKQHRFILSTGIAIPLVSLLILELTQFSLFSNVGLSLRHTFTISIFSHITTSILLLSSIYFFYTSLKKSSLELVIANTTLTQQNNALQTAYQELQMQQRLLEKTWQDSVYATLTETIAHELKNPLFEFGFLIEALKVDLNNPEEMRITLDLMGQTIAELQQIMDAILENGATDVGEQKHIQVADIINRVLVLATGSCKRRNIRIHRDIQEVPLVIGNSRSFLMIFSNLIVNAIEAMDPINRSDKNLWIRVSMNPNPSPKRQGLIIEIEDSGPGIPLARQASLFEGGHSTKDISERKRGIGLALTLKLVSTMGGEISVISNPDVKPGTLFRVMV